MGTAVAENAGVLQNERFGNFAWLVLAYNIGVVLWGAYVRATGSGAGCGAHWPLCNGEVIPNNPGTARLIEFSHRVTSGMTLVLVVALVIWAFRVFPKGHSVRLGVTLAGIFTVTEALVGAGLVLFQLVAENASAARAASVAVHLTNTFLLLAALALTAYWATHPRPHGLVRSGKIHLILALGLAGILLLGTSGAITALGDTLFPVERFAQGLAQDLSPTAQLLVRLRVFHPLIAIAVGSLVVLSVRGLSTRYTAQTAGKLANITIVLVLLQWLAGVLNIYLLAPIWLQLTHLLLADLLWVVFVLFCATLESQPDRVSSRVFNDRN